MDLLTLVVIAPSGAVVGTGRSALLEQCHALYEKIAVVAFGVWAAHGYRFRHYGHTG